MTNSLIKKSWITAEYIRYINDIRLCYSNYDECSTCLSYHKRVANWKQLSVGRKFSCPSPPDEGSPVCSQWIPDTTLFEMDFLKTFFSLWWTLGAKEAMLSLGSLGEPDLEGWSDKCHPSTRHSLAPDVSTRPSAPLSPEYILIELRTGWKEELKIGRAFLSIWSGGTFDPSDELAAWSMYPWSPTWSESRWPPENLIENSDLPFGSGRTEPDDSGASDLSLISFPHHSWWPEKWCSYIDPASVTTPLWHPWEPSPVLLCPPDCLFLCWKLAEEEAPIDRGLIPIWSRTPRSPHSRPKDLE